MPRTPLPVSVIQENIYVELQASQAMLSQIYALASIGEKHKENADLVNDIESVMRSLLQIGDSKNAKGHGRCDFNLCKVEP